MSINLRVHLLLATELTMTFHSFFSLAIFFIITSSFANHGEGVSYDYTAYTKCQSTPEAPLYNGGMIRTLQNRNNLGLPSFVLHNLAGNTIYSFSSWVRIQGAGSSLIKATITTGNSTAKSIGNVIAKGSCWSFLKGGFILDSHANFVSISFQNPNPRRIRITVASASLQPFTDQQWRGDQQNAINTVRKREATLHVSDAEGNRLQGATVIAKQASRDFLLGSAINKQIIENTEYQNWFIERFNAAVFENELKWYSTEPHQGHVNYTIPDQMLQFVRENQIVARGHNIFWEDPRYIPSWVKALKGPKLKSAVNSRIQSLMNRYKNDFINWDVSNEILHYDFYEERLGPNATLDFFQTAHQIDPLAKLFMNEFNVVENCDDMNSTVDAYISRMQELEQAGSLVHGIGLEGHFDVPNLPLIRAVLDKLATLQLPIWLTEVDIGNQFDQQTQARYLEAVLREGFSHHSVDGIILWTAMHPNGCYQMCLTNNKFQNLPTGNVVDSLLKEWQTGTVVGQTDEHGSFSFDGFLGEYIVTVNYFDRTVNSTFSLSTGSETKHVNIHI